MTLRARMPMWCVIVACLAMGTVSVVHAAGKSSRVLERRVKAAFLYKFGGYIEWPPDAFPGPTEPLRIAVVGDDQLARELEEAVAGRTSGGRNVEVVRASATERPEVNVLFVAESEEERLRERIGGIQGRPVLIVTESEGALRRGSMINFVMRQGRVRFEVNLAAVRAAHLDLSSRLLAVARTVYPKEP